MKTIKILFQTFMLILVVWFSSMGCVTKKVWSNPVHAKEYNETIISFYTNFQKNEIIFIGKSYHYFFKERTESFIQLLKVKDFLALSDSNLQIHASTDYINLSQMRADITVHFKKSQLNMEQKKWMEAHNFRLIQADSHFPKRESSINPSEETLSLVDIYICDYHIEGHRYLASTEVNEQVVKLKKPLFLSITEFKEKKKSMLYKIAMTPLSVTADAGLIVVGVGAAIIYAPFALTYFAIEKIKSK